MHVATEGYSIKEQWIIHLTSFTMLIMLVLSINHENNRFDCSLDSSASDGCHGTGNVTPYNRSHPQYKSQEEFHMEWVEHRFKSSLF
jgi:hypothetical protein